MGLSHLCAARALLLVSRFRALVVAASISAFLFLFCFANLYYQPFSTGWLRLVDISFWLLSAGSVFAGLLEVSLFWRASPLLSTTLLAVVGTAVVVVARVSSAAYSLLKTGFYTQPVGGSIVDVTSYMIATTAIPGSFMLLASTSISTLYRGPVVFRGGPTLHSLLMRVVETASNTKPWVLYVASFTVGLAVRLYPELKHLDLPVGWDTLEYISNARDFAYQPKVLTTYLWLGGWRNLPPLLTWVPGLLALAGIDPWVFFKVYPPVVVGLLSMLSAAIAYRLTGSRSVAFAATLLTVFNPYVLGQSQQWHRHVLGVVLLLAYLYLCGSGARPLSRALTLVATSLSYEPAAAVALVLSAAEAIASRDRLGRCTFALSASLSLLALLWYVGFPQRPVVALTSGGVYVAGSTEYSPGAVLRYTITCSLLLAPSLAVATIWERIDWRARLAVVLLLATFIAPALSVVAPVDQHRWFTMLLTALTPYTAAGLARLGRRLLIAVALVVVILGSAYPFTDLGHEHFAIWSTVPIQSARGYPWRMGPAVSNLTDVESAARVVMESGEPALVGLGLYPHLHLYIRNPENLVNAGQDPILPTVIAYAVSKNVSRLLVVTKVDLLKQLEEFRIKPDLYNVTMSYYLSRERFLSIDSVKCETLYRGSTLAVYVVEVEGSSSVAESGGRS